MALRTRPPYEPDLDSIDLHFDVWTKVWRLAMDLDDLDADYVGLDPYERVTAKSVRSAKDYVSGAVGASQDVELAQVDWKTIARAMQNAQATADTNARFTAYCNVLAVIAGGVTSDWTLEDVARVWELEIYWESERSVFGENFERMPGNNAPPPKRVLPFAMRR